MSRQKKLEDLKNLIISEKSAAVKEALANALIPPEKHYELVNKTLEGEVEFQKELQEAISAKLVQNRDLLEAVLSVIRCKKINNETPRRNGETNGG